MIEDNMFMDIANFAISDNVNDTFDSISNDIINDIIDYSTTSGIIDTIINKM